MKPVSLLIAVALSSYVSCLSISSRQETDPIEAIEAFEPSDAIAELAAQGIEELKQYEESGISSRSAKTCNLKDVVIRRDWDHLSKADRKAYINAVLCLQSKKSILDPVTYPGAKTRYDDFLTIHIAQTLTIHGTGNFLGWHRYFVRTYELALRNECGYKGYQPYWNWATNSADPKKSPVFDGSDTSLSGNGAFLQHNGSLAGAGRIFLPSELGGGCVTSGPFKNYKVNLGPISPTQDGVVKSASTYAWNPRCLKRDLSKKASSTWLRVKDVTALILKSRKVLGFQNFMQGDFPNGFLGVHAAGHFVMNGDPGGDLFASPGDPAFWLHHAMVDRVWWIWQMLNLPESLTDVAGTRTLFNNPPSGNTSIEDLQDLAPLAPGVKLGDLLNTLGGDLCYIYL